MAVGRWRRILTAGMALLLMAGLAACGDDDDNAEDTTTTAAEAGQPVVDIEMKDYAYTVSGPLTEGGTIRAKNTGKEIHMITVSKFKPGKTVTDLVKAFQATPGDEEATTTSAARAATTTSSAAGEEGEEDEDDPTADVVDEVDAQGGAGIFQPNAPAVELTGGGLEPGDYALMCFVNVEGDNETPHVARGMVATLKVVKGTAPAVPTADATYKIEQGKAITGPMTLTPGRHVLKLEASGANAGELEPVLFKPNPGRTFAEADKLFDSWDEGLPKGAVSQIPGLIIVAMFDFGKQTTQYIATDLTPGTYNLTAQDTDVDDAPNQPKEFITIKVA